MNNGENNDANTKNDNSPERKIINKKGNVNEDNDGDAHDKNDDDGDDDRDDVHEKEYKTINNKKVNEKLNDNDNKNAEYTTAKLIPHIYCRVDANGKTMFVHATSV